MAGKGEVDNLISLSIQLISNQKLSKAINLLRKVLVIQPGNMEAISLLSECLFITGDFNKAAQTWKMALKLNKHNKYAFSKLKYFYSPSFQFWLKRYHEAERLILNQEYDKAQVLLQGLLQENDRFVKLYELLGLCYRAKKQNCMAARAWEKGLKIDKVNNSIIEHINKSYAGTYSGRN